MNKEFIPYEQALALKELEFDEPCFASYVKESKEFTTRGFADFYKEQQIYAPLYQQAFRWFREKYNINGHYWDCSTSSGPWCFTITNLQNNLTGGSLIVERCKFKTPEEAEIECLKKLIEIIKANNKNEEQK